MYLKKLVYLDSALSLTDDPSLGRNFEGMDPLEWLARISDHIPDPGQHRTLFYGEYSSRVRGTPESDATAATVEPPPRRRCSASRCGQRMSILAFVSDQHSISTILEQLGLRPPERDRPPPPREIVRVTEQGEGWGVPASWD